MNHIIKELDLVDISRFTPRDNRECAQETITERPCSGHENS